MQNKEELDKLIEEWEQKRISVADPSEKKRCEIALRDLYQLRDNVAGSGNSSDSANHVHDYVGSARLGAGPEKEKTTRRPKGGKVTTQGTLIPVPPPQTKNIAAVSPFIFGFNRMVILRSMYVAVALLITLGIIIKTPIIQDFVYSTENQSGIDASQGAAKITRENEISLNSNATNDNSTQQNPIDEDKLKKEQAERDEKVKNAWETAFLIISVVSGFLLIAYTIIKILEVTYNKEKMKD